MNNKTNSTPKTAETAAALVPRLRFPEFRDSKNWEFTEVGSISKTIIAGGTPNTSEKKYWGGEIRWMNSGELNDKRVFEVQGRITIHGLNNSSTKIIPPRCVLIGLAGQGKTRGTVAMNMIELCTNQSIAAIFPNETVFNSDYLYHNLDYRYNELRRLSAGGEGRGGLNLHIIKSLPILLPTLAEQQRIADCLSSLDALIAAQARKVDALKSHKKGLMQQLFPRDGETQPRLRFPEFQDAGEWEKRTLKDTCQMQAGKFVAASDIKEQNEGNFFPCYGGNGLRGFTATSTHEGVYPLIGRQGALCGNVKLASGKFHATEHALVANPRQKVEVVWLYYVLNLLNLNRFATGQAQPGLSVDVLEKVPVAIPPTLAEQQRIADCLSSLDDLITAATRQLATLKTHKQGLMQQLFPSTEETTQP